MKKVKMKSRGKNKNHINNINQIKKRNSSKKPK